MKTSIRIFLFVLIYVVFQQLAYSQNETIKSFAASIQNGDSKQIAKLLNENVELNIEGNRQSANKNQSEVLIGEFMKRNPLVKFEYTHKGSSGSSSFAIGKYISNEQSFRVVIKANGDLIEKIDFTKE